MSTVDPAGAALPATAAEEPHRRPAAPADPSTDPSGGSPATGGGPAGPWRRLRRWTGGAPVGLLVAAGAVVLLFAGPLVFLVQEGLSGEENLVELAGSSRTLRPLSGTLRLAAATAVSASVVGTGLAWLTTRTDLPLRPLWATLAPLPLVIPSFVGALALLAAVSPGGLLGTPLGWFGLEPFRPEGFMGAWVVLTLFTTPYVLLPVAARLIALPPSLEESARLLGRSPFGVFRTVVLPQISGSIWAGGLLVFLYTVSDFGAVVLLRYDTLTRAIFASAEGLDRARALSLSLLLALLALTVVAAERTVSRRWRGVEGVRGRRPLQVPLGRWRWPALAAVVGWVTLALGGPLASLGLWAWRGLSGGGSRLARGAGLSPGSLQTPAANTVIIGLVAAIAAVAVLLPLAYLSARHRAPVGDLANGVVAVGFAVPGLVIALSIVSWTVELPAGLRLRDSFPVLVVAYVVNLGVLSLRATQVAVAAVPRRLDESARILGAGRLRRLLTVEAPLMLPGLAAGGGLVLLSTMKELPITLLLAPLGFETLATRIWENAEDGFLPEAGLASLVLVALSGVLTWLLVVRRTERLA